MEHSPISPNSRRAAACLVCRRSKIKCERGKSKDEDDDRCQRCVLLGSDCVRPAFHVGRRKGVKNKRTGLEKALHLVEEAARKSGPEGSEAVQAVSNLKALLGTAAPDTCPRTGALRSSTGASQRPRSAPSGQIHVALLPDQLEHASSSDEEDVFDHGRLEQDFGLLHESNASHASREVAAAEESLAIDDAENPLQLLARASDLHVSPPTASRPEARRASGDTAGPRSRRPSKPDGRMSEVERYFKLSKFSLDVGPDLDPIDLGLVTEDEAESLFGFFHQSLAHTRWGLDPLLYTVSFTRARSAFLLTSIAAAAALFMPAASALSKRLSNHCRTLFERVIAHRYRSVEIVLAFLVNVPWMFPGKHSMEDDTCWSVSLATTMAIDLSLHKTLVSVGELRAGGLGHLSRADCIDPALALSLDGFADVEPGSEAGRRLLRRRERCWIALFVLERGMCLARGRTFTVPITPTLRACDQWHLSDIADTMDGHLVSTAVLRRDLDTLFTSIRALCDGSQEMLADGSAVAISIQMMIEQFFNDWHAKWGISIGIGPQHGLPPYVQILVTHTRLSLYSSVINHPTAPTEVRRFFHSAGLSSALNVMRAAIQGEKQLTSMPNNTAIMISFAACFALRLGGLISGNSSLAPSIRTLIEEAADVLERIGCVTRHRRGMSALYGRYLKCIVRKAASARETPTTTHERPLTTTMTTTTTTTTTTQPAAPFARLDFAVGGATSRGSHAVVTTYADPGTMWSEPMQFSTMSDDQVVETLSRVHEFDGDFHTCPSWNDTAALDWMNWSGMPEFGS